MSADRHPDANAEQGEPDILQGRSDVVTAQQGRQQQTECQTE